MKTSNWTNSVFVEQMSTFSKAKPEFSTRSIKNNCQTIVKMELEEINSDAEALNKESVREFTAGHGVSGDRRDCLVASDLCKRSGDAYIAGLIDEILWRVAMQTQATGVSLAADGSSAGRRQGNPKKTPVKNDMKMVELVNNEPESQNQIKDASNNYSTKVIPQIENPSGHIWTTPVVGGCLDVGSHSIPTTVLDGLRGGSHPSTAQFTDIQHLVSSGDDKMDDEAIQCTLSRVDQPNSVNTIRRPLEISAENSRGTSSKPTSSTFSRKNFHREPVKISDFISAEPAAASSYKTWIRKKNTAKREQQKTENQQRVRVEQERKQREVEIQKNLSSWLRAKSLQRIRENELKNLQEAERVRFTERRSKEQCEKAYKDWLRKKALEQQKHAKGTQERSHFAKTIHHRMSSDRILSKVVPAARVYQLLDLENK